MVTSSRRWRAVAMLIVVLAKPPPGERGFLFVANRGALSDARSKHEGDLRYALRSACATGHPVRLVVETPAEAGAVRPPCGHIDVVALRNGTRRRAAVEKRQRQFKLEAILAGLADAYPGGTLYLDNDVAVRAGAAAELFGVFDSMRRSKKAVGLSEAHVCVPKPHRARDVPDGFCERNGGVVFFGDAAAGRSLVADWLAEFEARPARDGHDQMALRRVLWRRRSELYNVPEKLQCRGVSCDPCAVYDAKTGRRPLLWHLHHKKRQKRAKHHKLRDSDRGDTVCGFAA